MDTQPRHRQRMDRLARTLHIDFVPRVALALPRLASAGVGTRLGLCLGLGLGVGTTAGLAGMGMALPRLCATLSVLWLGAAAARLARRAMDRDDDVGQRNALHGAIEAGVHAAIAATDGAARPRLTQAEAIHWLASHTLSDLDRLCGPMGMPCADAFPAGNRHLVAAKLTKCLVARAAAAAPVNEPRNEPVDDREPMRNAAVSALQAFGMPQPVAALLTHCDFEHAYPLVLGYLAGRTVQPHEIDAALCNAAGPPR